MLDNDMIRKSFSIWIIVVIFMDYNSVCPTIWRGWIFGSLSLLMTNFNTVLGAIGVSGFYTVLFFSIFIERPMFHK